MERRKERLKISIPRVTSSASEKGRRREETGDRGRRRQEHGRLAWQAWRMARARRGGAGVSSGAARRRSSSSIQDLHIDDSLTATNPAARAA